MIINKEHSSESLLHQFRQNTEKPVVQASSDAKKSTFISRVERFATRNQPTPGPGSYESLIQEKHTLDYKVNKVNDNSRSVPIQHAWISDSNRISFLTGSQSRVGPGQYLQTANKSHTDNHSSWAKCSRFQQRKAFYNKLGPGQYNEAHLIKKKVAPLAVFKSKSPRTFFEQLMAQTKKQQIIKKSNPEEEDLPNQIVRFDETQYPAVKKINKKSPIFMSKSQRPELINQTSARNLGPGYYSVERQEGCRTLIQRAPKSGIHYSLGPVQLSRRPMVSDIGPGSYHSDLSNSLQKLTRRQPLGIISKQQRFKSTSVKKNSMPGPGQYMQNRFTMIIQQELRLKNKGSFVRKPEKVHNFGTAPRSTLRNHNEVPFGHYEVKNYDIKTKLEKQKEQYEKLRLMQVTLPAFNSKQHQ